MNATSERDLFERMTDRVLAYRPKKAKSKSAKSKRKAKQAKN
jgi:hypothetical protein